MHTATADFLSVLWGFLHSFWFSSLVSPSLPQSLKNIIWQTLATLRAVIDDDKVIVEGLQTKMINTQQTVEEIEVAEERIRDCIEVSRRNIDVQSLYREDPRLQGAMPYSKLQEMEQRTINGDADLNHRNDDCARHAEQLLALQQERKALQKTIKQCEHKQKQLEKRIMSLEKRQQEFERQQAETEGKASLQTIWEWIKRVLRF
jgi:chromosome segregation ATPase